MVHTHRQPLTTGTPTAVNPLLSPPLPLTSGTPTAVNPLLSPPLPLPLPLGSPKVWRWSDLFSADEVEEATASSHLP